MVAAYQAIRRCSLSEADDAFDRGSTENRVAARTQALLHTRVDALSGPVASVNGARQPVVRARRSNRVEAIVGSLIAAIAFRPGTRISGVLADTLPVAGIGARAKQPIVARIPAWGVGRKLTLARGVAAIHGAHIAVAIARRARGPIGRTEAHTVGRTQVDSAGVAVELALRARRRVAAARATRAARWARITLLAAFEYAVSAEGGRGGCR